MARDGTIAMTQPLLPVAFIPFTCGHRHLLAETMRESIAPRAFIEAAVASHVFALAVHPPILPLPFVHCWAPSCCRFDAVGTVVVGVVVGVGVGVSTSSKLHATIAMAASRGELAVILAAAASTHQHTLAVERAVLVLAFVPIAAHFPPLFSMATAHTPFPLSFVYSCTALAGEDAVALAEARDKLAFVSVAVREHQHALALADAIHNVPIVGAAHPECWRFLFFLSFSSVRFCW